VAAATLALFGLVWAARSPGAQADDPMNLVLVLTDDQTFESLSKMPYVDGRDDWTRFTNAFIQHPLCCPSRATVLTGRYSHHHGVQSNAQSKNFNDRHTLATWLSDGGYETALIGKYFNFYPWSRGSRYIPPGWDHWFAFEEPPGAEYYDYEVNDDGEVIAYGSRSPDYSTDVLARRAQRFIETSSEPFFLEFAPNAPHGKPVPAHRHEGAYASESAHRPPDFDETDVSDKPPWWRKRPRVDRSAADNSRRKRHETLLAVDEAVKDLFDALDAKDALQDTVVVFMTDNGFSLGEHRWTGKVCQYEECIRTPLLIRNPHGAPRTIGTPVSNIDLAPTLADLAGVSPSTTVDGRSLVPLLQGETLPELPVLLHSERASDRFPPRFWGIRTSRYKYVRSGKHHFEELYDLLLDPYELQNRAGRSSYAAIQAELRAELKELKSD
jgi:arylsulfatase A-like enzyme